ncbi:MAG: phage antirepressor KilAC domain-containing protein [Synergistaceae bacterium]|nr:phage antirepressor KilAC domain-containing protein [Synergistaceae bacterium]
MTNELQVFKYTEQHQIRTTVIDGEPWFVAKDICDVLGLADVTSALRTLDDDEKLVRKISGAGQIREMATISEPGLYKLIMRSSKPEAKQFTRWVTHEVLPSIHKSGMYLTDQAADVYVHDPKEFAKMAARCSALEGRVKAMEKVLNEKYSLSVLGETVLAQPGCMTFQEVAGFLAQHGIDIGQNRLFNLCRDLNLLCSRKGKQWNKPTQKALDKGLFNLQISGGFRSITMFTPKGMQAVTDKVFADQFPLLVMIEQAEEKSHDEKLSETANF